MTQVYRQQADGDVGAELEHMMKKLNTSNLYTWAASIFIAFLVCAAEVFWNSWQGARVDLHSRLLLMVFQQAAVIALLFGSKKGRSLLPEKRDNKTHQPAQPVHFPFIFYIPGRETITRVMLLRRLATRRNVSRKSVLGAQWAWIIKFWGLLWKIETHADAQMRRHLVQFHARWF